MQKRIQAGGTRPSGTTGKGEVGSGGLWGGGRRKDRQAWHLPPTRVSTQGRMEKWSFVVFRPAGWSKLIWHRWSDLERLIFLGLIAIVHLQKCLQSAPQLYTFFLLTTHQHSVSLLHSTINRLHVNDNQMVSAHPVSYYWWDTTIGDSNKQIMPMSIIINIRRPSIIAFPSGRFIHNSHQMWAFTTVTLAIIHGGKRRKRCIFSFWTFPQWFRATVVTHCAIGLSENPVPDLRS